MKRALRKLEHLQKEVARYRSIEQRMDETGETQVSLSDPDARSMATTARMPRIVGYNVQTAVEADNHLIVAHEGTMLGFDRDALSMMAVAARDEMTTDQLTAIADKRHPKFENLRRHAINRVSIQPLRRPTIKRSRCCMMHKWQECESCGAASWFLMSDYCGPLSTSQLMRLVLR
jgi:hypothetical protein